MQWLDLLIIINDDAYMGCTSSCSKHCAECFTYVPPIIPMVTI